MKPLSSNLPNSGLAPPVRSKIGPRIQQVETLTPPPARRELQPEVDVACPKCGNKLINPESLGLCQSCGYCRSLEDSKNHPATRDPQSTVAKLGMVDFFQIIGSAPTWGWGMGAGIVGILCASLVADHFLPVDSLARALWSMLQILLGLTLVVGTQFYAVMWMAEEDTDLGAQHFFIFSPRLWVLIFKNLPKTRWLIWLEMWGITLALAAILLVGGFGYWGQLYRPREIADQSLVNAAAHWKKGDEKVAGEKPGFTPPDVTKPTDSKEDPRPSIQCAIIGFIPNEEGQPRTLILASRQDGKWKLAGTVRRGLLPEDAKEIGERLADYVQFNPQISGLSFPNAVWVEPKLFCTVNHSGIGLSGQLVDPSFKSLLNTSLILP